MANHGDIPTNLTIGANQSVRRNAADNAYEAYDTSASGDLSFTHIQGTASDTWNITHNLGKYPSVTVVNNSEIEVIGDVTYTDTNNLVITFTGAFSGKAYLN